MCFCTDGSYSTIFSCSRLDVVETRLINKCMSTYLNAIVRLILLKCKCSGHFLGSHANVLGSHANVLVMHL